MDGKLPLLVPMSEVAGRMAIQVGASSLEKAHGGRGVLMGGVPGVEPANVLILGGGTVGINAAKMAAGMGAHVTTVAFIGIEAAPRGRRSTHTTRMDGGVAPRSASAAQKRARSVAASASASARAPVRARNWSSRICSASVVTANTMTRTTLTPNSRAPRSGATA